MHDSPRCGRRRVPRSGSGAPSYAHRAHPRRRLSGQASAEATNTHSLESFSDPIWFEYRP